MASQTRLTPALEGRWILSHGVSHGSEALKCRQLRRSGRNNFAATVSACLSPLTGLDVVFRQPPRLTPLAKFALPLRGIFAAADI